MDKRLLPSVFAFCAAAFLGTGTMAAGAAPVEASAASSFGVSMDATLLERDSLSISPTPSVSAPDEDAKNPDEVSDAVLGPIQAPANGSLITDLRSLDVSAERTTGALPTAHAEARTGHVALFEQNGVPLIEADAIHAVADAQCTGEGEGAVTAEGSRLANAVIGGQSVDATPPKNTEISLLSTGGAANPDDDMGIRIILNEQTEAGEGVGLTVTMIHVIAFSPSNPDVVFADLRIASATATVFCGDGAGAAGQPGSAASLSSDQTATSTSDPQGTTDVDGAATAFRGDEVAWTITIRNDSDAGWSLVEVIDVLPQHFTFVGSTGDLTATAEPAVDGQTVTWSNPSRWSLSPGESLTERITATVDENAPFGTYTNLVEIDRCTCSSFTQGLSGPVEVIARPGSTTTAAPSEDSSDPDTRVLGERTLPATGLAAAAHTAVGLALLGLGTMTSMRSRVHARRSKTRK